MPLRIGSGPAAPAAGPWSPGAPAGGPQRPEPVPPGRASVVRPSATRFGIVGRTVITVVVLAVGALVALGNVFGIPVYVVFLVWVLRDLWTRERRSVTPPRRAAQARTVARAVPDEVPGRTAPAYDRTVIPPGS